MGREGGAGSGVESGALCGELAAPDLPGVQPGGLEQRLTEGDGSDMMGEAVT